MKTRYLFPNVPYGLLFIAGLVAFFLISGAATALQEGPSQAEESAPPEWHKGASIRSSGAGAFATEEFQESLEEWAEIGGNYVTLILPWMQQNLNSNEVYPHRAAPLESALAQGIEYAHELGLAVNLLPHVDTEDYQWRARIEPSDPDAWFESYGEMLLSYAEIAEEHGVEMITIGTELVSTTGPENTQRWRDLISQVREVYSGELTYSSNWGGDDWSREKDHVEFWDDLDYIGIAAYFFFDRPHTVTSVREQWDRWERSHIRPLQEEWDMPVLFTEVGYRSVEGALQRPWDWDMTGPPDHEAQAVGYEALLGYWSQIDYFRGVHIWNWRVGSESYWESDSWEVAYTPQRKAAQDVLREQFGQISEE